MKVIHTADLHLGQVIYQNYERVDEHQHFFSQLTEWCKEECPDALLVSGDVFDIQQPSATTKKAFNDYFVSLHQACPHMHIVITAGNHDSASRIQADNSVWKLLNTHLIGASPSVDLLNSDDRTWMDNYIITLDSGYIIALPFMVGERQALIQSILDHVAEMNTDHKPVVMMGHLAMTGMDATGHDIEIGKIKTLDVEAVGKGYDYLALGHIHKPQTIGHQEDCMKLECVTYPSGVIRYSGSALHVSCDEQYPHTVSVVDIDKHGGSVSIRQLRINELRHFYTLPLDDASYQSEEEVLDGVRDFCINNLEGGYIRLRISYDTVLSANFTQQIYDLIAPYNGMVRYNAKIIWAGAPSSNESVQQKPVFEIADLQQMTNPMAFIEKTFSQYPGLDLDEVRQAFEEVRMEILREKEEKEAKEKTKKQS
ncbi:MAG: exonuclease SbcCD subunit D [Bacteroidaceae bacterium]|nr:exonuclease SbcCD subunit D [Bacteroidaceae bacterium]